MDIRVRLFEVVVQHAEVTVVTHDLLEIVLEEHLRWAFQCWIDLAVVGLQLAEIGLHLICLIDSLYD